MTAISRKKYDERDAEERPWVAPFKVHDRAYTTGDITTLSPRRITIASPEPAAVGDECSVLIRGLPALRGIIDKICTEGFSVAFMTAPYALIAHALSEHPAIASFSLHDQRAAASAPHPLQGSDLAWARLKTTRRAPALSARHHLSVLINQKISCNGISTTYLKADNTEWIARLTLAGARGPYSLLRIPINPHQFNAMLIDGMTLTVQWQRQGRTNASPLTLKLPADYFNRHRLMMTRRGLIAHA